MKNLGFKQLWGWVVWAAEKSDIIPPIIAVSAWHYAGALTNHDPLPIAVIIGVLVDLGHYRSVKSFFKHNEIKRLALAVAFTLLTGWYHFLWYGDLWLALAMPALIIGLSLLSYWDKWERQAHTIVGQTLDNPPAPLADVGPTLAQPKATPNREFWRISKHFSTFEPLYVANSQIGPSELSRLTGVNKGTCAKWLSSRKAVPEVERTQNG